MSKIRYQVRALLPRLENSKEILKGRRERFLWNTYKKIIQSNKSIEKLLRHYEIDKSTFYRDMNRILKAKSLEGLLRQPSCPKRVANKTRPQIERKVVSLRKAEPYLGADRISHDLQEFHNIKCPPSTVNAILNRNGLISKETEKKRTKKHMKRYRRPLPGYLQLDIKYVPEKIDGYQYYQISAIDHHSSWRLIRTYGEKSSDCVLEFLNELIKLCPFPIFQIQTDNDKAFTDKYRPGTDGEPTGHHPFDLWCAKFDIQHKLIPIGQKELNGKVENSHKQDDREFYSLYQFKNYYEIKKATVGYNYRWNYSRRTKTLRRKTPFETVMNAYVVCLCYFQRLIQKYDIKPFFEVSPNGNVYLNRDFFNRIPTDTKNRNIKKPKKKSKVQQIIDRIKSSQDEFFTVGLFLLYCPYQGSQIFSESHG